MLLFLLWTGAALGIVDHLRRRFARFKLGVHLLEASSKRCNLFLQLFNCALLLQKGFVLFEEFIQ